MVPIWSDGSSHKTSYAEVVKPLGGGV
jgi:hypothetical protein